MGKNKFSGAAGRLEGKLRALRVRALFLMLGLLCICMAVVCLPMYRGNPSSYQSLWNLMVLMPPLKYLFIVFLVAGLVFVVLGVSALDYHESKERRGHEISPEERVRIAREKETK
jgi:hypothetical protein